MIRTSQTPYLSILLCLLIVKALAITFIILNSGIGLSPDEAQYWTWSQQLDLGYYSKPPGIAWQIFLGTYLFGNTVLGVRALSIIFGFFIPLTIYLLARKSTLSVKASFYSALLLAFSPLGFLSSMLAITDVGMILFWTLSLATITDALSKNTAPNYYLLGTLILLGALFKWPIYLIWLLLFTSLIFYPSLRSMHSLGGLAVSLLGLLPSFTWNIQHDFATFKHVSASIQGTKSTTSFFQGNFFDFIGAQAALFSPILFLLLLLGLYRLFRNRKEAPKALQFCAYTTAALLLTLTTLSLFKKVQGNWCDYAYPSAAIVVGWYAIEYSDRAKKWLYAGILLSILLLAIIFSLPTLQSTNNPIRNKIPYKVNPFRHNLGWQNLPKTLESAGYKPEENFLFSSKYQMSSILSFYAKEQKRAYFLNLFGIRKNQFSYWPSLKEEQIGKTGYYVIVENKRYLKEHLAKEEEYRDKLTPYFNKISFIGLYPLFTCHDETCKGALIFRCEGYNGKEVNESQLY